MIKVKVIGECYKKVGHKEIKRIEYNQDFILADKFQEKALMVVRRMLIEGRLSKEIENYSGVKTCSIDDITEVKKELNVLTRNQLNKLSRQELIEYAAAHGLFFRGSKLGRIFEMRDKICEEVGESVKKKDAALDKEFED